MGMGMGMGMGRRRADVLGRCRAESLVPRALARVWVMYAVSLTGAKEEL
jgi:hypothetical protein